MSGFIYDHAVDNIDLVPARVNGHTDGWTLQLEPEDEDGFEGEELHFEDVETLQAFVNRLLALAKREDLW